MPRLTFAYIAQIAESKGFDFYSVDGGYELCSNEKAPGVTGVYKTLQEAWDDVAQLLSGCNPLDSRIPV